MGSILAAPIRSQLLSRAGDARFRVGASQMQGFRSEMEDAHRICLELEGHPGVAFFGVYDGHSGDQVAKHLAKELHHHIARLGPGLEDEELQQALVDFDLEVGKTSLRDSGSTCVFVLVRPLEDDGGETKGSWRITAANVGDSRAMLIRKGGAVVSLTEDHKPSVRGEDRRIRTAGGFVQNDRVDGQLAMSRAIGDYKYKGNPRLGPLAQKVIALPTLTHSVAHPGDRLLIVCDGIVERISNKEVAKFVHATHRRNENDPAQVMRELNLYSLARGSTDNHSGVLVCFENGVNYAQPDTFVAGPLSRWKGDKAFVTAYLKNANAWGQSGDSLLKLIAEADKTMPADWRQVSGPSDWMDWWPAFVLFVLVTLLLYEMARIHFRTGSDHSDGEYW